MQTAQAPSPPSLLESLKLYLNGWVCLLKTRIEIISTELEEERVHLAEIAALAASAFFCLGLGVLLITCFIVALLWDHHVIVLGAFSLLYLGLGSGAAILTRRKIKTKPKLFATTLTELAKDEQHLSSQAEL